MVIITIMMMMRRIEKTD